MKKNIQFILIGYVFILLGCTFKNNVSMKKESMSDTDSIEDFDDFRHKFYADSLFQLSRIVFPLKTDIERLRKSNEARRNSDSISENWDEYIPYSKDNWDMLTNGCFENDSDSIGIIDDIKYKRVYYRMTNSVEVNIMYADSPKELICIMKFQLMKRKWYLIDFVDLYPW